MRAVKVGRKAKRTSDNVDLLPRRNVSLSGKAVITEQRRSPLSEEAVDSFGVIHARSLAQEIGPQRARVKSAKIQTMKILATTKKGPAERGLQCAR